MSVQFITFGSHNNYIDAARRLVDQANSLNLFDKTTLFTADDLKQDPGFWPLHQQFINSNLCGYGHWLWKPYLIKKTMETMADGDILLYLDCGCELDIREKEYMVECIEAVKQEKLIGTDSGWEEHYWNKMDLVLKMDANSDKYLKSTQKQAGTCMYLVCPEIRKFVNEWYELGCDYHNIDNSCSIAPNLPTFREHRHDQSIFSLLTKKYDLFGKILLDKECLKIIRNISGNRTY